MWAATSDIIGNIDLMLGKEVDQVIDLYVESSGGRFAGIRYVFLLGVPTPIGVAST
jgi:hypothetical protein